MGYLDSLSRQNATVVAMEKYSGLSPKNTDKSLMLSELRHRASEAFTKLKNERETMKSELAKKKEIYSTDYYAKFESEAKSAYAESVRSTKRELRESLEKIIGAKQNRLAEITMKAPSAEQLALLQTFSLRTGNIGDAEMEMLLGATVDCYQALAAAKSLLEAHGKTFAMPFDPNERKTALDDAAKRIGAAIDDLDSDDADFSSREFFQYDGYGGFFTDLCAELDGDPSTAVETPELTILERLTNAQEREYGKYTDSLHDGGGYLTGDAAALYNSHEIKDFIRQNKSDLATPDEKRRAVENAAEKLLEKYEDKPEGEE